MKIIFLGTPEFAVATLDAIINAGYEVVAVITSPNKLGGRGMKQLIESAVKVYAVSHNIPVLQPTNLKSPSFLRELRAYQADLQVVVAFRMLPELVWDMPPLGTYNLHGSLLPDYRGAAPINWAIINGETTTGVTSFKLKHAIDTGSIALQQEIPIDQEDDVQTLHDKMMLIGAALMVKTLQAIDDNTLVLIPQEEKVGKHAPKIFHEDCQIDFSRSVVHVYNFIRGLSPYPTAWFMLEGKKVKVFKTSYYHCEDEHLPGQNVSDAKNYWKVKCANGYLNILDLQEEGRKRMPIKDFLNGTKLRVNNSIVTKQTENL